MIRNSIATIATFAFVLASCANPPAAISPLGAPEESGVAYCTEVPALTAPEDKYRETPVYVGNEMPVEEVQAWAQGKPGYQGIWIDREHNGWISVAFTEGVEERQSELEAEFPNDGVVAVETRYTTAYLDDLQERVGTELSGVSESFGSSSQVNFGVVSIDLASLDAEVVQHLSEAFPGEPICVSGPDPSEIPQPGPQAQQGDGWRLLFDDAPAGEAYRTGIAADPDSLRTLWDTIGLDSPLPEVDFENEVVIWFGAVYGSSCPDLRLDDVIVDGDLIYANIVLAVPQVACTDDANPHAYIIALDRARLPQGPFRIQLGANDPPRGVPEERTVVDANLSVPGSTFSPAQVGPDPALPGPDLVESGDIIEPGYPASFRLYAHCGIEWLGELNGVVWRTEDPFPGAWQALMDDGQSIAVEVLLLEGDPPTVEATAGGRTLTYLPSSEPIPGCD